MKASELIKQLNEITEKERDFEVFVKVDDNHSPLYDIDYVSHEGIDNTTIGEDCIFINVY